MNGAQLSKGVIREGMGLSIPTACVRESLQISGALGFSVEHILFDMSLIFEGFVLILG